MTPPPEPNLPDRLQRLEEAQAFTDHGLEQLGTEIALLNRRLAEVQAQVRRLEAGLARLRAPEGPDSPASDQE